jgi:hypothetical protein
VEYVGDKTICDSVVLPPPLADTVRFVQHMARYRTPERDLTAAEVKSIQAEFLAWLDARVTAGFTIEQMNIELNAGKLLSVTDTANVNDFGNSYSGFVGTIRSTPANADAGDVVALEDLILFLVPIYTGPGRNEDETLVLYQQQTRQRVGWINSETTYERGFHFGAVTGEPLGIDGLIATDWIASNCTSNWSGQILSIDSLAGGHAKQIMTPSPAGGAFAGSTKIQVDSEEGNRACRLTRRRSQISLCSASPKLRAHT